MERVSLPWASLELSHPMPADGSRPNWPETPRLALSMKENLACLILHKRHTDCVFAQKREAMCKSPSASWACKNQLPMLEMKTTIIEIKTTRFLMSIVTAKCKSSNYR